MAHASCYHVGYALTCAEYDDLVTRAAGCCELCERVTARPCIDHDHSLGGTWAVRGLLCGGCNQQLRHVDSGRIAASARVAAYLSNAWHLGRDTTAKRARVRPRGACPACGKDCALRPSGAPSRHWSRLPGKHDEICPGAQAA